MFCETRLELINEANTIFNEDISIIENSSLKLGISHETAIGSNGILCSLASRLIAPHEGTPNMPHCFPDLPHTLQ